MHFCIYYRVGIMPSNIKAVDKYVTPTCVGNNIDEFLEVSNYLELITQCLA